MGPIHLSTILAHNTTNIISQIARLSLKYGGHGHTILFALSANFPRSEDLQQVVNTLIKFNDTNVGDTHDTLSTKGKGKSKGHTLGCLAGSFSSTSLETSSGSQTTNDILSCSIGIFNSDDCVPFRSTLAGRPQPQVGRWHSFRKKEEIEIDNSIGGSGLGLNESEAGDVGWPQGKDGGVNWEEVWNRPVSEQSLPLPDGLRQVDPSQIETMLTFSSPHPDKLTRTISRYLLSSTSNAHPPAYPHYACLIAAPTHFVTGREVTLIMDGEIYGEGAVGVAFLRPEQAKISEPRSRTEFLGVKILSRPMSVTSREGNMINALDNSNPTRLLLSSLSEAGIYSSTSQSRASFFKDDEQFALGVLDANEKISRAYKITAGDPSSRGGSLSLDAPWAPEVGSIVQYSITQFLHQPSNMPVEIPASLFPSADLPSSKHVLGFLTVPEPLSSFSALNDSSQDMQISEPRVLENTFLVPSTGGFTVSGKAQDDQNSSDSESDPTWSCSMPGGIAMVEWY